MFKEKPCLESLFDDLSHPNPYINNKAASEMAKHWPAESTDQLISNLNHKDISLRRSSIKALGAIGSIALPPLCQLFKSSSDRTIRTSVFKAFLQIAINHEGDLFPPEAMNILEFAIDDDTPELKLTLVSLCKILGDQGLPLLIRLCKDENILGVQAAVTALGEMDSPIAKAFLREFAYKTTVD